MKAIRFVTIAACSVLILCVFLLAAAWIWRDAIINEFVRPRVAHALSKKLKAEVDIGHVQIEPGLVVIGNLGIAQPKNFRLDIPETRLRFSLPGLLQRSLQAVELEEPQVWFSAGKEAGPGEFHWPARPDFNLEHIEISHGKLEYQATQNYLIDHIDLQARGTPLSFKLQASVGRGRPVDLAAEGIARWHDAPSFEFENLSWDGHDLLARPMTLQLGKSEPLLVGSLSIPRLEREDLDHWIQIFGEEPPLPAEVDFFLSDLQIDLALPDENIHAELAADQGWLSHGEKKIDFTDIHLQLNQKQVAWESTFHVTPRGQGRLSGDLKIHDSRLDGEANWSPVHMQRLQSQLLGRPLLRTSGALEIDVRIQGTWKTPEIQLFFQGRETPGDLDTEALLSLEPLSGEIQLNSAPAPQVHGHARIRDHRILEVDGTTQELDVKIGPLNDSLFRALFAQAIIPPDLAIDALTISGVWQPQKASQSPWEVPLKGAVNELRWQELTASDVTLSGHLSMKNAESRLQIKALEGSVTGMGAGGSLRFAGELRQRREGLRILFDPLELTSLEYFAPSGQAGFLGGRVHLKGHAAWSENAKLTYDIGGTLQVKEVLKDTFYADLSSLAAQVSLEGEGSLAPMRWEAENLRLSLGGVANVQGRGQVQGEELDLRATLDVPDLGRAWEGYLRPVLEQSLESTRELNLAGSLGAYLSFRKTPAESRMQGRFQPDNLKVVWPEQNLEIQGMRGQLPFDIHLPPSGAPSSEEKSRNGELAMSFLTLGPARLAPGPLQVAVAPNSFQFRTPLVFFLHGGVLSLSGVQMSWEEEGAHATARVKAAGVDLGQLTSHHGWPDLQGTLAADLGRIYYQAGTLTTEGRALINVFGGRLTLDQIRGERLSTAYPVFSGDLEFAGVDLLPLTTAFSFGEISGIVDGRIENLRLFGLMPTHFRTSFESRTDGERYISVKAVRNLTLISQGGLAGALSRGIYQFIDYYNYRKIGVFCSLENDVFTLRGTAVPGENYLVEGGFLPPKINIIAPENQISFREMVKRVTRIERTQ